MNKWYLTKYKPKRHKIALENLKRQGFDTFFPLFEHTIKKNEKFINSLVPLFPGYIFVSFDICENKWTSINYTIGISKIVSFGNKPAEVPEVFILELMQRYSGIDGFINLSSLNIGNEVKIIQGPFSGLKGEIEDYDENSRLKILLKLMGFKKNVIIKANKTDLIFR